MKAKRAKSYSSHKPIGRELRATLIKTKPSRKRRRLVHTGMILKILGVIALLAAIGYVVAKL